MKKTNSNLHKIKIKKIKKPTKLTIKKMIFKLWLLRIKKRKKSFNKNIKCKSRTTLILISLLTNQIT